MQQNRAKDKKAATVNVAENHVQQNSEKILV